MEELGKQHKVARAWEWKQQLVLCIHLKSNEHISLTRVVDLCGNIGK